MTEASNLGIASCIVARGEETFSGEEGSAYLRKCKVPENTECKCFVLLGYVVVLRTFSLRMSAVRGNGRELLCNAFGLGTVIMSYSAEVLDELVQEARRMLNIPGDHDTKLIVGFGYPEITYATSIDSRKSPIPSPL